MTTPETGERIRIAVSGCLLGEAVRYDGGHRRHSYVEESLAVVFELVSECPEVGIGLGTPRPPIRLERVAPDAAGAAGTRLVGSRGEDLTRRMEDYAREAARRFAAAGVAGIVLKARSPSCGMGDVKVHEDGVLAAEDGDGVFARQLQAALPGTPRISENDLEHPARRDHWLTRVFAAAELGALAARPPTIAAVQDFHARWKMVLMAHSERTARELGRALASLRDAESEFPAYRDAFLVGLAEPASVGTHHNVLLHLAGHLRKRLDPEARSRLNALITAFRDRQVPLAAPIEALNDWAETLAVDSLRDQAYLAKRPKALRYREQVYPA